MTELTQANEQALKRMTNELLQIQNDLQESFTQSKDIKNPRKIANWIIANQEIAMKSQQADALVISVEVIDTDEEFVNFVHSLLDTILQESINQDLRSQVRVNLHKRLYKLAQHAQ
jgi:hypothetical protein